MGEGKPAIKLHKVQKDRLVRIANTWRAFILADTFDILRSIDDLNENHENKPEKVNLDLNKTRRAQIIMEYAGGLMVRIDKKPGEKPGGSMATSEMEFADCDGTSMKVILFGDKHTRLNIGCESIDIKLEEDQPGPGFDWCVSHMSTEAFSPETLRFLEFTASLAPSITPASRHEVPAAPRNPS